MEVPMPVLAAAVDFLAARLEKLGGPWKFPFAGVAIDEARQYTHDKDLAQIWAGCNAAAKEMAIYPSWAEFILSQAVMHVGCKRLLRAHLTGIRNFDLEAFQDITQYFDEILLNRTDGIRGFKTFLKQLEVIGEFLSAADQGPIIRDLIAAIHREQTDRDTMHLVLMRHLPPAETIADIVELDFLSRVLPVKSKQSNSLFLKFFYLGCQYPEQLPDRFHQLSCVVGALTSSSILHQNADDLLLTLRSFVNHIFTTSQQTLHSWWNFVFDQPKMSLSEIAVFALVIESVFDKRNTTKTWMEMRSSWLHAVMILIKSEESGCVMLLIARMAQLNSEIATSADTVWPSELNLDSARSCLLRLETNLFNLGVFTRNWKVQRYAFRSSVSKASSLQQLCSGLLNLERHLETQVLPLNWSRRVGLWGFPLLAIAGQKDCPPFEMVKNSALKIADSISVRHISRDFYSGSYSKWRLQVAACQYLYPLCELLIDLETGLEFEATASSWADYRSEWGLHVHSSFTASMLSQCLLDLARFLTSCTLRNASVWRRRLSDLTLVDEPGRLAVLKRSVADMIRAIADVHWTSRFRRSVNPSNTNEESFYMQLAACRTVDQVSVLMTLAGEMLQLPEGKALSRDWFRAIDNCYTTFYLSACLIAFDTQLSPSLLQTEEKHWTPSLRQVRTSNISNVSVRALRTILLLLEDHLILSSMVPTWPADSALWRQLCSWQTTEQGIRLACEMLMVNLRQPFIVPDSRSKTVHDILLLFDESLSGTAINSSWNSVRGLCRISLRQDVPSEITIAVCLDHLVQNLIKDDKCISRGFADIPSNVIQMKETLLALPGAIDFSPIEPKWTDHYEVWRRALESAQRTEDLAMPILTFAAFIDSLPSKGSCRFSICFQKLKEIWEHTLLGVVESKLPAFLKDEVPVQLPDSDLEFSRNRRIDMGYDRILPVGLYRVLDVEHAKIRAANSFADLGMGTGQALLQVFCDSSSPVQKLIGVEASSARFRKAVQTTRKNISCEVLLQTPDEFVIASKDQRMLTLRCGDLFECEDGIACDIVLLFVSLTSAMHRRLCKFVSKMRPGSRLITTFNIPALFDKLSLGDAPFRQIPVNRLDSDRFLLQSCPSSGKHLFVFVKV